MRTKFKSFLNEELNNREIAQKIAFELGEEIVDYLGAGAWGKAFSTKSGKVLKLTSDSTEFIRAFTLSRTKYRTKYLINYYNVGKVESIITNLDFAGDGTGKGQYYILMDQVFPVSDREKRILSSIGDDLIYSVKNNNIISLKQFVSFVHGLDKKVAEKLYPHIINIAKELKKHHITFYDFHGGNVGWDKDRTKLVFFDIGGYTEKVNYERNNKKILIEAQTYKTANDLNQKSLIQIVDENDKNCGQAIIMKSLKTLYHVKYKTKLYKVRKIDVNTNIHGQAQLELIKLIMI
jgi:hypothetical protein